MKKLKCPGCNTNFKLNIAFTGCDWETDKGDGSGYNYPVSLYCNKCGAVYTIGHIQKESDFTAMTDEFKVVE